MQDKNPKSTFGIDINEYTENPDFNVLGTKVDFIYLRASGSGSGKFRIDSKFIEFAKACKTRGILTGGYHYAIPSYNLTTADLQCDDFIETLQKAYGKGNYGKLMPVIDVEEPKMNPEVLLKWINRFRQRFEKKTRRRLMIYVSFFFVEQNNNFKLANGTYPLDNMPLWIAMYTSIQGNPEYPPTVGNWEKWRMWQFTDKQSVDGVDNLVDANYGPNNLELLMQPGQVKNFKAVEEKGFIQLTWTKNKDIDLAGYNIFVDNYWIGTVDKDVVSYKIPLSKIYKPYGRNIKVSIEAFDYEGETSQIRSKINLEL